MKKILCFILAFSCILNCFAAVGVSAAAEQYGFAEDFEDYVLPSGVTSQEPTGWTSKNPAGRTFEPVTEGDNTYLRLKDANSTSTLETSHPVTGVDTDFMLGVKFRTQTLPNNNNGYFFNVNFSNGTNQPFLMKNIDGLYKISCVGAGNTSDINAILSAPGVTNRPNIVGANTNQWYDIVFVSKTIDKEGTKRLEYYVDGVYQGYRDGYIENGVTPVSVSVYSAKTHSSSYVDDPKTFDYDDIYIYNSRPLDVSFTANTGSVESNAAQTITFSAPVTLDSVKRAVSVKDADGKNIDVNVVSSNKSMTEYIVTPVAQWTDAKEHTITVAETVADVLGNTPTQAVTSDFTVKPPFEEGVVSLAKINADIEEGHIKGSVTAANYSDNNVENAKLYVAAYNDGVLESVYTKNIDPLAQETHAPYDFDIDVSQNTKLTYNLKFFLMNSSLKPLSKASEVNVGNGTPKLFIIGDSTADSYVVPASNAWQTGWGKMIGNYFEDELLVRNHAKAGSSTKTFYNSALWTGVKSEIGAGDYLIIQFGHNDISSKTDSTSMTMDYSAETDGSKYSYKWYMKQFVDYARSVGATPVIATSIAHRMTTMNYEYGDHIMEYYNDESSYSGVPFDGVLPAVVTAKQVAADLNVTCLDVFRGVADLNEEYGIADNKYIYLFRDGWAQDDTHVQQYGADLIANIVKDLIAESDLPIKQLIKTDVSAEPVRAYLNGGDAVENVAERRVSGAWLDLAAAMDKLGAWDYTLNGNEFSFTLNGRTVSAEVGSDSAMGTTLSYAPELKDGKVYVHSSFFKEAMKYTVKWNESANLLGVIQGSEYPSVTIDFENEDVNDAVVVASRDLPAYIGLSGTDGTAGAYTNGAQVVEENGNKMLKAVKTSQDKALDVYTYLELHDNFEIKMKVKTDAYTGNELRLGYGSGILEKSHFLSAVNMAATNSSGKNYISAPGCGYAEYTKDTWYEITLDIEFRDDGTTLKKPYAKITVKDIDNDSLILSADEHILITNDTKGFLQNLRWQMTDVTENPVTGASLPRKSCNLYIDDITVTPKN